MTRHITNELILKVRDAMRKASAKRDRFFRIYKSATQDQYEDLLDKHYMRGKR